METEEQRSGLRGRASGLALGLVLLLALAVLILIGSRSGSTRGALHAPADPTLPGEADVLTAVSLEESRQPLEEVPITAAAPRPSVQSDAGSLVEDAAQEGASLGHVKWRDDDDGSTSVLGVGGRVVDTNGRPCEAHVSLVSSDGGSIGLGTAQDGVFEFSSAEMFGPSSMTGQISLQATTADGLVAVLGAIEARDAADAADVVLTLEPGAKLSLSLDGVHESLRCRLLHDGVIFEDFTLRKNQPAKEVVPAGALLIQLYSGGGRDMFLRDERALYLRAGEETEAAFVVDL